LNLSPRVSLLRFLLLEELSGSAMAMTRILARGALSLLFGGGAFSTASRIYRDRDRKREGLVLHRIEAKL
jgi:hypothetical protein